MALFGPPNVEKLLATKDVKGLTKALTYLKDSRVRSAAAEALGEIGAPDAVQPLIGALGDADTDVRASAVRALVRIGAPGVEPLIAALEAYARKGYIAALEASARKRYDEDEDARAAAVLALGQIGDARAVDALVRAIQSAFSDRERPVRDAATQALAEIGAPAVAALISALDHKVPFVRIAAAEALRRIGEPAVEPLVGELGLSKAAESVLGQIGQPAVEPLIAALKDRFPKRRRAAAQVLDELGWTPEEPELGAWYHIAKQEWGKAAGFQAAAVEPLITVLEYDFGMGTAAARALGLIGDPRGVVPLAAALRNKDTHLRQAAAHALGQIGDARAADPLIAALAQKDDPALRSAAVQALAQISDPRVIEPLMAALKHPSPDVRKAAVTELARLRAPRVIEPLMAALKDPSPDVREAAVTELARLGAPRVIEPLVAALKDPSSDVRKAAATELARLGDPQATPFLQATLGDESKAVRRAAADALHRLGWEPDQGPDGAAYWVAREQWDRCVEMGELAVDPLINALEHDRGPARVNAVTALGRIGDARALGPMIGAARSKDNDVRRAAAQALGQMGDTAAARALVPMLGQEDEDARVATASLLQIGGPAAEPLIAALKDTKGPVCLKAADLLAQIGDARAAEPLVGLLKEVTRGQKEAVARALVQIGAPAVEPLIAIAVLEGEYTYLRLLAARALVELYRSGSLDDTRRQRVLALRETIIGAGRPHEDSHYDDACVSNHMDIAAIHVAFPL